jgi:hypothetical protein
MAPSIKGIGPTIEHKAKGAFSMLTETNTMGPSSMTSQMGWERIRVVMALCIQACGKMTYSTDREALRGPMGPLMLETTTWERSMVLAAISGQRVTLIKVNGSRI